MTRTLAILLAVPSLAVLALFAWATWRNFRRIDLGD